MLSSLCDKLVYILFTKNEECGLYHEIMILLSKPLRMLAPNRVHEEM